MAASRAAAAAALLDGDDTDSEDVLCVVRSRSDLAAGRIVVQTLAGTAKAWAVVLCAELRASAMTKRF